jgi:hypothetical protein
MDWFNTALGTVAATAGGVLSSKYTAEAEAIRATTAQNANRYAAQQAETAAARSERLIKYAIGAAVVGGVIWAATRKAR